MRSKSGLKRPSARVDDETVDTGCAPRFILDDGSRDRDPAMDGIAELIQQLLANPIVLIPILLMIAALVYAILKKLLKIALIVAIAGVLYVVLVETFGAGM